MMHRLINRWSPSVFVLFLIIEFLQFLRKLGFVAKEDGWRKATRAYLCTEESKYVLTCFGLNFRPQLRPEGSRDLNSKKNEIIKKLREFFQQQPTTHWQLKWTRYSVKRIKKDRIDIVQADFDEDGSLKFIIPYLDDLNADDIDDTLKDTLRYGIVEAYNETKDLDDKRRPWVLKKQLDSWLFKQLSRTSTRVRQQAKDYIERILSATFIHFEETILDYRRFEEPLFIKRKHPGFGFLNIICRLTNASDEADLWIQFSHICGDGVPMQEMLQAVKANWAVYNEIKFPPLSYKKAVTEKLCSTKDNINGVYYVSQFVNFNPFLKVAKEIKTQYANQLKVTPFRLFLWELGNRPAFKGKKFLIPIDLPALNNRQRSLGFVLIRPSIYFDKDSPEGGFLKFQDEFERQVQATLTRCSESYELFESYALLPLSAYSMALKLLPSALRELGGSIGVTVIREANLFISPFSDVHTEGFIAISNFLTPTEDGSAACYINIKGPKNRITDYLSAVEEIAGIKWRN